jgi:DegV family protein with EDD domain
MMQVAVVTDSASELDPAKLANPSIAVVPLIGGDVDPDEQATCCGAGGVATLAPSRVEQLTQRLVATYEQLAQRHDAVLSIHSSHYLAGAYDAARAAREQLRGLLPIEVVDSGLASIALGFVVRRVARAARGGANLAELEFLARQARSNVHAMFFAESVDYLNHEAHWRRTRAWPISGNGTRPLLNIEDGEVRPLERVRTRARGYDRLAEFVELFPHIEQMAILHDAPAGDFELFMRRIDPIYPREMISIGHYGPTLREQLGPRAIAVFVDQGLGHD